MVNRTGAGSQIPDIRRGSVPAQALPRIQPSSAVAGGGDVEAELLNQSARVLAGVSDRLEQRLDIQAEIQARNEGVIAGNSGVPERRDDSTIRGRAFNISARDAALTRLDLNARQRLSVLEEQHSANPIAFSAQATDYLNGNLRSLRQFDPEAALEFENRFSAHQQAAEKRIATRERQILADRQLEDALRLQSALQENMAASAADLFSDDPELAGTAYRRMIQDSAVLVDAAHQIGPDGTPLFNARQRIAFENAAEEMVVQQIGLAWMGRQDNAEAALSDWASGKAAIEIVDEEGNASKVNLQDVFGITVTQKVLPFLNQVSKERREAEKKQAEFQNNLMRGALFARGDAFLNPQDSDSKKAFNVYYEAVQGDLAQLSPGDRNRAVSRIISQARFVPELVKGDIQAASLSRDPEVIAQAADLLDLVTAENPHLEDALGAQSALTRLRMINDRLTAGYDPKEAFDAVESQLDPRSAPSNEVISAEIKKYVKDSKLDFREEALKSLSSFGDRAIDFIPFFSNPLSPEGLEANRQLDVAQARYRMAWEDGYRLTRDPEQAKKAAALKLRGQFGRSEVNGMPQIMEFAPEKYYGINGLSSAENAEWMREQMIDEAAAVFRNTFTPPSRSELKRNLRLIPVPSVTSRTAAQGQPVYNLIYMKDGAIPQPVSPGQYFVFDPEKARADLIEKARLPSLEDDVFGPRDRLSRIFPAGRFN